MPLLDHFHEPGVEELYWGSVGGAWAVALMGWLNRTLPRDEYRAFANMYLGPKVEADVAEFERRDSTGADRNGSIATEVAPPAVGTISSVFPDDTEVLIRDETNRLRLAGVIELVSPGNKKEVKERDSFVAKCAAYLQKGIGLVVIDVVTSRLTNLHNLLMARIGGPEPPLLPPDCPTYVVGYRPVHRRETGANEIEMWPYAATVGQPVPAVPLALRGGPVVMLDLEGTYTSAIEATGL
jgi:hypothetical protein